MLAESGERLGFGLVGLVNVFNPEVIVIGGGAVAAGDLLLEPAREVVAARALPPARDGVRIVPAHFGDEAGMVGAGAARAATRRARSMSGPAVVCPTPIGNLEDITLRVLSALREADVVACEDTRRTRVLLDRYGVKRAARLLPRAQRGGARRPSSWSGCATGRWWRSCPTPGMPLVSDPGYVLVRACVAAGLPVEVLPGPSAAITALVASGAAGRRVALRRASCRARRASCARCSRERAGRWSRSSRRAGCRPRSALLAELDPDREVAVCRELTKVHEEVVRGTAAELAARYAEEPPKGEVVLVLAPPRPAAARRARSGGARRPARLVDAGAQPRRRRRWWPP